MALHKMQNFSYYNMLIMPTRAPWEEMGGMALHEMQNYLGNSLCFMRSKRPGISALRVQAR